MNIKSLDLSRCNADDGARGAFHGEVLNHLMQFGFVKFRNHGIDDELIAKAFQWAHHFFALPLPVKEKAQRPKGPGPNRGYAFVGQEQVAHIRDDSVRPMIPVSDVKESFDAGPSQDFHCPTPWPPESDAPGFRQFITQFYDRCSVVHGQILDIIQTAIELPDIDLSTLCDGGNAELRITHYPSVEVERIRSGTTFRIAEHSDIGILTLLFQDQIGGLEVEEQDKPGQFLAVTSQTQSEMIVNVGDTLQRWTNGRLRSANHRVVAPAPLKRQTTGTLPPRYSVAFFGKANLDAPLRAVGGLAGDEQAGGNEGVTAADYYSGLHSRSFATTRLSQA